MSEEPPARVLAPEQLLGAVRALAVAQPLLEGLRALPGDTTAPVVYLVGGAVRDLLLGRRPRELDLCLDGDPTALAAMLGGPRRVHGRFGTCTVELGGVRYDIARTRSETYARPGALPDVGPAGIERDLERRDFTVNAMALALTGPHPGQLHTAPCAIPDLEVGILRVLHAGSFRDDPTRLLRLVRYRTRLGFAAEGETGLLARAAAADGALGTVSGTRVGNELRLLAREANPVQALAGLGEFGLEAAIAPGFGIHDAALARRALALLPADGRGDLLVLAVAVRGLDDERRARLLRELGFTAPEEATISTAAGHADAIARRLRDAAAAGAPPSAVAAAVGHAGVEAVALAGALGPEAPARLWLDTLRHVRLTITGEDLIGAGIVPGPAIGRALRAALAARYDGHAAGRDEELAAALDSLGRR